MSGGYSSSRSSSSSIRSTGRESSDFTSVAVRVTSAEASGTGGAGSWFSAAVGAGGAGGDGGDGGDAFVMVGLRFFFFFLSCELCFGFRYLTRKGTARFRRTLFWLVVSWTSRGGCRGRKGGEGSGGVGTT